jgi:hypothetical protein
MIREELKLIKEDKRSLRKFGLTVGIVLLLIGVVLYLFSKPSFVYFGGIGLLLTLFGIALPNLLRPINKVWMTLAIVSWLDYVEGDFINFILSYHYTNWIFFKNNW